MGRVLKTLLFLGLATATWWSSRHLEPEAPAPYDVAVVPSPAVARLVALGHPILAANLYWLETVQYVGEARSGERGWEKLAPLLSLVTDLDPRHGYAYQVGGVLLGTVGKVPQSNALLEKGMRNRPDRYILPYLRAFNAFYYDDDWVTAGRFAEAAARTPGAPAHVRQNALAYYVKGRRADSAVAFLEQALSEARDVESRKALENQLLQARLELAAATIDEAAERWRRRHVIGPFMPEQLVEEGYMETLPADPAGGSWYMDEDGRARSTVSPYRFRQAEPYRNRRKEPGIYYPEEGKP